MNISSDTLKNRLDTMRSERIALVAATEAARAEVDNQTALLAAGRGTVAALRAAQDVHAHALGNEQAHGTALAALSDTLARVEREQAEHELLRELSTIREKISLLENRGGQRVIDAERDTRAAWTAWTGTVTVTNDLRAQGRLAFQRLQNLRGLPSGTGSKAEKDAYNAALNDLGLQQEQRLSMPPASLILGSTDAKVSGDEHAARWRTTLSQLEERGAAAPADETA